MQQDLGGWLEPEFLEEGLTRLSLMEHVESKINPQPGTDFSCIAALEASLYMRNQLLRDADWASMAHSLEIRLPLVDVDLLKAIGNLTRHSNGKQLLARAPKPELPQSIAAREKTGFTTPIQKWLNGAAMKRNTHINPHWHWSRNWAREIGSITFNHCERVRSVPTHVTS
jgi:asparagine synthase (glutamine-hydrolysing)